MRARSVGLGIRCLLNEMSGLSGRVYGTAARLPIGGGSLLTNLLPDDLPLNPGDYENTPAINPRKPAIPRQLHPKTSRNDIGFRQRIYSGPLRGQRDLGTVTTAAPLKTFADFFDERGGVLGAIGGNSGGHKAGYWGRGWSWGM